jgi:hypothetical protein
MRNQRRKVGLLFLGILAILTLYIIRENYDTTRRIRNALSQSDDLKAVQSYDSIAAENPVPMKELIWVFKHGNVDERYGVMAILNRLGYRAAPALPVIVDALKDANSNVRRGAAGCLPSLGLAATNALNELEYTARNDPDFGVRLVANFSTWKILHGSSKAIDGITNAMASLDRSDLQSAINFLENAGVKAKSASPTLKMLLGHTQSDIRMRACRAIVQVDPIDTNWLPVAVNLVLESKREQIQALSLIVHRSFDLEEARIALDSLKTNANSQISQLASTTERNVKNVLKKE